MVGLPRDMISSLTASQGDFDHVENDVGDGRWEDKAMPQNSLKAPLASQRKRSSRLALVTTSGLEIISEYEESIFEAVPVLGTTSTPGSEELVLPDSQVVSPRSVDQRWKGGVQDRSNQLTARKPKAKLDWLLPSPNG